MKNLGFIIESLVSLDNGVFKAEEFDSLCSQSITENSTLVELNGSTTILFDVMRFDFEGRETQVIFLKKMIGEEVKYYISLQQKHYEAFSVYVKDENNIRVHVFEASDESWDNASSLALFIGLIL